MCHAERCPFSLFSFFFAFFFLETEAREKLKLWGQGPLELGLCWMWQYVPFAHQRRPVVGVLGLCWLLWGSFDCFCCHSLPLCVSVCVSPRCPAPHGVLGDLRCTVTAPSSLVLPTPVLSEVRSLAWPTIPLHWAPQAPQRWPTG